jgi:L-alanine-DL-glutamate epimerase-like enolase superfamily enzyme
MKVARLDIEHVVHPLAKPVGFSQGVIATLGCVLVTLTGDGGVTGESLTFTINDLRAGVVVAAIESLRELVVGADPDFTAAFSLSVFASARFVGQTGLMATAIAAIDNALWDLRAKAAGTPLHRLLGAARSRVPVYHSGGMWVSQSIDEIAAEAEAMVGSGFKAVKMRVGNVSPHSERARVRAVRQAIGPETLLMVDANQRLDEGGAVRLADALQEYDIHWLEEPLPSRNIDGLARVRAKVRLPVATGESEYTSYGFRRILEARAADVLMPDLQRVGGVSEFLRVAHLAHAYDTQVSAHLFPEMSLSLMAAFSNGGMLEYCDWLSRLYREPLELADGMALVSERPGWGFTFDRDYIRHLKMEE